MKVLYAVWADLPSKAAHSLHFMKQCQGLAANAFDVELIFPRQAINEIPDAELYNYYNVKSSFALVRLALNKKIPFNKLKYCISVVNYAKANGGVLFTRDIDIAGVATFFKLRVILELHRPLTPAKHIWGFFQNRLLKSPCLLNIIVITQSLKDILIQESGIQPDQIIVAHDASDLPENTTDKVTFDNAGKFIAEVGYVGHLYKGKGIELIFKVAALLPNVRFHIVGGLDNDIKHWKEEFSKAGITNTVFHGFVTQKSISAYLNSFDVCLLPNQRVVEIYGADKVNISNFTSPLKMFDYMAHGKAIVASDLAVLREVLNENNAVLCDPDDAGAWAAAIQTLAADGEKRSKLGANALHDFEGHYTWTQRANIIMQGAAKKQAAN